MEYWNGIARSSPWWDTEVFVGDRRSSYWVSRQLQWVSWILPVCTSIVRLRLMVVLALYRR